MAEIENIIARISSIFSVLDLKYVVVGGIAAIVQGKPRTTTDINLILENNPPKIQKFLSALKNNGFEVLDNQVRMAFESRTHASIFDKKSTMRLDVKIATSALDREALNHAEIHNYFGVPLRIASVNYVLLGKLWFLGDISDIEIPQYLKFNDIIDFINVFLQNKERVDIDWLKDQADQMNLTNTYTQLMQYIEDKFRETDE